MNKRRGGAPPTSADGELIAYLVSDSIHSGSIAGEIERLRKNRAKAKATLEGRLRFELQAPKWPLGALARCALALYLLDHPNVVVGAFKRQHETRRPHHVKTGLGLRCGVT